MYTSSPNTDTKAVCALENWPGIPTGKIWNCHIMVKKWKKMKISTKNGKKKKKKKMRSGQLVKESSFESTCT